MGVKMPMIMLENLKVQKVRVQEVVVPQIKRQNRVVVVVVVVVV
jgi:hypothetical protein